MKPKFSKLKKLLNCNEPRRTPDSNKTHVVKACENGQEKLVRFGDPDMPDGTNDPKRRKSYCARSGGIKGGDGKLSANYWSRKNWRC